MEGGHGRYHAPARLAGLGRADDAEATPGRAAISTALTMAGMAGFAGRRVTALSGGERARAHVARALATEAAVILADEPMAHLDPAHQIRLARLFRQQAQRGRSVVLVLHDLTLAQQLCDQLVLLHHGRQVAAGAPEVVLTDDHLSSVYGIRVDRWRGASGLSGLAAADLADAES